LLKHRIKRIRLRKQLRLANDRTDIEAAKALKEIETSKRTEDSALTSLKSLDGVDVAVPSYPYFTTEMNFIY
jgi:hypothetical protein